MTAQIFTVQTPTGARVLHWIGHGFAAFAKEAIGPGNPNVPTQRLQYRRYQSNVKQEPDGVLIGPRQLLTIGMATAQRRKGPVILAEIIRNYFWPAIAPRNAAEAIAALPDDEFIQTVRQRFGWFDPTTGTIWPLQQTRTFGV